MDITFPYCTVCLWKGAGNSHAKAAGSILHISLFTGWGVVKGCWRGLTASFY